MILICLAVVLFLCAKVIVHFNEKYDGMIDGSRISMFVYRYWRTAEILPGPFMAIAMICVWLETKNLVLAQMIALLILGLCGFSMGCGLIMCAITILERVFGRWDIHGIRHQYRNIKTNLKDWIHDWKHDAGDMLASYTITGATFIAYGVMLIDMTRTIISEFNR